MAGAPGGKDERTISDMFRSDAYGSETLSILKQLAAAANQPKAEGKAKVEVSSMLDDFGLIDMNGAGAGPMPRLQRGRAPERMGANQQEESAVATKESVQAPESIRETAAVSGVQNMIAEVFSNPDALEAAPTANSVENPEAKKESTEAGNDFDLFQLG